MGIEKMVMAWMNGLSNLHAEWRNRRYIGSYEPYSFQRKGKEVDLKTNSDRNNYEKDNKA